MGAKLVLWWLCSGSLPLTNNLRIWQTIYPSQCVSCLQHSDTKDHLFLQCPEIKALWVELAELFSAPLPRQSTIQAYLICWWRQASSATMMGHFRAVIPAMVLWVIWKEYTSIRFGDNNFSYRHLFDRVRRHIYSWCASVQGRKFVEPFPNLIACGFSPHIKVTRHRLDRWKLPPSGRMKLNVDAAVGRSGAAAGAVLRNDSEGFVSAVCFALPSVTPVRAELMALLYSILFYAVTYDGLHVETDWEWFWLCLQIPLNIPARVQEMSSELLRCYVSMHLL